MLVKKSILSKKKIKKEHLLKVSRTKGRPKRLHIKTFAIQSIFGNMHWLKDRLIISLKSFENT